MFSIWALLFLAEGAALLCLGRWFLSRPGDPKSAEKAVRRAACSPDSAPAKFTERETHRFEGGMLISYDTQCSSASGGMSPPFPGYVSVERLPRFTVGPADGPIWAAHYWDVVAPPLGRDALTGRHTNPSSGADLVTYTAGSGEGWEFGGYRVVVGRALEPRRAAAVEAVFGDGRTARQRTDRGMFAIAHLGPSEVRELQALGADGRILQSIRVSP